MEADQATWTEIDDFHLDPGGQIRSKTRTCSEARSEMFLAGRASWVRPSLGQLTKQPPSLHTGPPLAPLKTNQMTSVR